MIKFCVCFLEQVFRLLRAQKLRFNLILQNTRTLGEIIKKIGRKLGRLAIFKDTLRIQPKLLKSCGHLRNRWNYDHIFFAVADLLTQRTDRSPKGFGFI